MARLHYLQHVPFEGLGYIGHWAEENRHTVTCTPFYQPDVTLPRPEDFDLLVVMGGPMNVDEEEAFPWLAREKAFLREVITATTQPVLGICLGCQLIGRALGAEVSPGEQKEIGWFPVQLTPQGQDLPFLANGRMDAPSEITVFHWHRDQVMALPDGAQLLASTTVCENQAFLYRDRVLALQFHLESTPNSIHSLAENCASEIAENLGQDFVQSAEDMLALGSRLQQENQRIMAGALDYLLSRAGD